MIIDCISDLHGHFPELPGGDLLIIAGDLTARDERVEYQQFFEWLLLQNYRKKILVAGNHDNQLKHLYRIPDEPTDLSYLCDWGTEFEGLKIWGSPWTKSFPGMNPKCKAFVVDTEEELAEKFKEIPVDVDILITHSPPNGILDTIDNGMHVGSMYLRGGLEYIFRPKLWVWGHIHESYGEYDYKGHTKCVNASYVNGNYEPVNKPIRIIL